MHSLRLRQLFAFLLALVVLFQSATLLVQRGQAARQVLATISRPAMWRAANFYGSQNFAEILHFLRATIPEEARVVLPPSGVGPQALSHTPAMQFFLSPRTVLNCSGDDPGCAAALSANGAYVLVVTGEFPGENMLQDPQRLQLFNGQWGVYLPAGAAPGAGQVGADYARLVQVVGAALLALGGLLLASVVSWPVAARLTPGLPAWAQLALGYGLFFGWLTGGLYLALLAGLALGPPLLLAITLLWALLNAGLLLRRRDVPGTAHTPSTRQDWLWLGALVLIAGLAAIPAAGKSYSATDEVVLWGAKGYGIAAHGLQAGAAESGTRTTAYPLNVPLSIAAFRALGTERLPASKLIFPGYALALSVLLYAFLRAQASPALAGLATLALITTPLYQRHAAIAYANLPLAYALCTAVLLGTLAEMQPQAPAQRLRWAAGLFFALAAWTRPEGLALSGAAGIFLAARAVWRMPRIAWRNALGLLAPLLAYAVAWGVTAPIIYPPGSTTGAAGRAALASIAGGELRLNEGLYLLRYFVGQWFERPEWGLLGFALAAGVVLALIGGRLRLRWLKSAPAIPLWVGLGVLLAFLGIYYLLAFDTRHDLSWWLATGFTRMILPGVTLLWVGLVGLVSGEDVYRPSSPSRGTMPA